MSNPYAAPRVDEPGEGRSTNVQARLAALVIATFAGPLLGYVVGDLIVSPHPETRSPTVFLSALMMSPFFVSLRGGVLGPLLGLLGPLLGPLALQVRNALPLLLAPPLVFAGLSFWPVYLWLSWRWIRSRGSGFTLAAIIIWLFLGYFGMAEHFEMMMGV